MVIIDDFRLLYAGEIVFLIGYGGFSNLPNLSEYGSCQPV